MLALSDMCEHIFRISDGVNMTTWIFQANPELFDIDGALADSEIRELGGTWLGKKEAPKFRIDDIAYIYKCSPTKKVIAKVRVTSEFKVMRPIDRVYRYWTPLAIQKNPEPSFEARIEFMILDVANSGSGISRDKLQDLDIKAGVLGMTNHLLSSNHADKINREWELIDRETNISEF